MTEICVYMTSVSSRLQISKQQRAILDFLDARGIEYRPIDMCANTKARGQMLDKLSEDKKEEGKQILPPQVFNGEDYCGDYEQFFDARECDLIYSFFKLNPPEGSSEYLTANPPKEAEPEEAEEIEEVEEEEEEEIDHEAELKDVQPANEDTPMDAEGGEEKMELFAALKKESGEGVPDVELVEEPAAEVASEENAGEEEKVEEEKVEETVEEAVEEAVEENEEEVEYVEEQPVEDTAEVEEYNSDAE